MKKIGFILLTMVVETIALWIVARIFTWSMMDVLFLGSVGIFAVVWLLLLSINQSNNTYNAHEKGWTGQDAGGVKQFHVNFNPVMVGMVLYMVISLVLTVVYYAEYL